jgi:hypothetical protein
MGRFITNLEKESSTTSQTKIGLTKDPTPMEENFSLALQDIWHDNGLTQTSGTAACVTIFPLPHPTCRLVLLLSQLSCQRTSRLFLLRDR